MSRGKILVVDDSPIDLRLESAALQAKGYDVITAVDGEEALDKAARDLPALVVLDVVLPRKINGFQICRQIKSHPATKHIKVILLSSKNQESDRFWGLKNGCDLYMTKPFDDEELIANVEQLLSS